MSYTLWALERRCVRFFCPRTTRFTKQNSQDGIYIERLTNNGIYVEIYNVIYNGKYHGGFARYLVQVQGGQVDKVISDRMFQLSGQRGRHISTD